MAASIPAMQQFRTETTADGILHLIFDAPGRSMNVFSNAAIHEIEAFANWLPGSDVRGVVVRSGKASAFCAGADLGELGVAYDMIMAAAGGKEEGCRPRPLRSDRPRVPQAGDGREAGRRRDQWPCARRRVRVRTRLPLPRSGRHPPDGVGAAGIAGWAFPGWRRHAAHAASDRPGEIVARPFGRCAAFSGRGFESRRRRRGCTGGRGGGRGGALDSQQSAMRAAMGSYGLVRSHAGRHLCVGRCNARTNHG